MTYKPCIYPRCGTLVADGTSYCTHHTTKQDDNRPNSAQRGYGHKWRRLRSSILARDKYICQMCLAEGKATEATLVDHILPISAGGPRLDPDNLQSLCVNCHAIKTPRDGSLGFHP